MFLVFLLLMLGYCCMFFRFNFPFGVNDGLEKRQNKKQPSTMSGKLYYTKH